MSSFVGSVASVVTCPGLFQPSAAQDGLLSRLRIPGGLLTVPQCEAIADLADQAGSGSLEVTNRANVQIRGLQAGIATETLERLQTLGLASPIAAVDALRNIMGSPTAGIDRQQLIDTRPLVAAWNRYLMTRPDFAVLSPKFSVCFGGGEAASVRDRPNDISLVAVAIAGELYFQLHLSLGDRGASPYNVGVLIKPEESLQVLIAMTEVYRDYTLQKIGGQKVSVPKEVQKHGAQEVDHSSQRKPRLRELLHDWSVETYLQAIAHRLPFLLKQNNIPLLKQNNIPLLKQSDLPSLQPSESMRNHAFSSAYNHLGIHPQRQPGLSYIGCVLALGRLETTQWRGLATLAAQYGSEYLRLTPWQTVLLPDIPTPQIEAVQQAIAKLGLHRSTTHPYSAIVACSGTTGCKSSATDTQANALALGHYLEQRITLAHPINIHFSGCEKSCAQHHASDIMLLGVAQAEITYHIYLGDDASKFGRLLYQNYAFKQLLPLIERMLRVYQERSHVNEIFRAFVNRYTITELKQLFNGSNCL